ncbi:YlbE family protein [Marinitenerispora sediminis]|uniref:DUF1116 domain-containing protein n=1 Tax=Marinitenerispora sediminis TaxID=1931232 RepID=A0A368T1W4_9ACTN|nr:DUF1116 domain-containing protein [Marinitenerispora sediminis]RCV48113.1 hypothetical protein DEF23_25555 [Marinitenerispora sediminis]RCV49249.1 hypothetical protein DEF24_25430 [Marinitenerispora sediminis]RCV52158.1 hypothetical protein DEF28_13675 [Marinitenerispora sediminis]
MTTASPLLSADPAVVVSGADLFGDALADQAVPVTRVDFRPPLGAGTLDDALVRVLADPARSAANAEALRRVLAVRPRLVDVRPAGEALGLEPGAFLHAGPPVTWERASGPLRGALMGAMVFEGLAESPEAAELALAAGTVRFEPCHHHAAVGPMAGVVSPGMWMFEVVDAGTGRRAWCSLNEGLGRVLRYGAYGPEVIERLRWMSAVLGPLLRDAVRAHGPVDLGAVIAQMLQMGDEGHNRNRSGTLMLLRDLLPHLVAGGAPAADVAEAARFVGGNDHFFLNLAMAAGKLMMDAGRDVPGSTLVVAMARNGTDFGIQVSGTGNRWFTGPAQVPEGLFLGSYGPADANPDIGDSAITETCGIGGFAMAAAPAIVRFVGGDVDFALRTSRRMYEITLAENPAWQLPVLDFRGTPTGIDVTRVVRTGLLPQINTGMAGRVPGTGQVGAGLVHPPAECFTSALRALAEAAPALPGPA